MPTRRPTQAEAARALTEMSEAFADAWGTRKTIEGPRQAFARDAVYDVRHGMTPRKALLLCGFPLDTTGYSPAEPTTEARQVKRKGVAT